MNSGIPRSQMGLLADKISEQFAVWETHCDQSGSSLPSVGFDTATPVLTAHTPDNALEAREKIIDSAFKLLHLAAGPSKFASMAISYVRTRISSY
jgi:6-hydroxytryprostatin B O-methyltransferase